MAIVFLFTGLIATIYTMFIVKLFPPAQDVYLQLANPGKVVTANFSNQIAAIFTVPDFSKLLSHENMLALIVFSVLVGLAAATTGEKGKLFTIFLQSGEEIFMRVFSLIMYYAPLGFLLISPF